MKKSKWILLVEDDASTAELTMLALAPDQLACDVVIAHDGLEALDCLHHRGAFAARGDGNPAFVLLDLKMPRVDGLEVLRQIRADVRLKFIPVVMFTSSGEAGDVSRSYQLGANAYVIKPVGFREFSETLESVGRFWAVMNEPPPAAPEAEARSSAPAGVPVAHSVA